MAAPLNAPLRHITREALEPVWSRLDIPTERIAETLGVTRQGLSLKAKALGLPSRAGNQTGTMKVSNDLFRLMWLAGVNTTEIAEACGYACRSGVSHRADILGLPRRTRSAGGKGAVGGWNETISLAEFHEIEIAERMRAAATGEAA